MKKSLVSLIVGAGLAFSATAQDQSGSTESANGSVTTGAIATGVVAVGVLGAVIANNRGSADIPEDDIPGGNGCNGDDELNADGFCVGTTDTVTGTATATTMTSVTFTYAPAA
ncbi:hypothetical protein IT774_16910 [Salinimonas marina]|uniref:Secreted protein n=1 Tax=Salinimonas marina TaxID=2785918 RepID=A0A7S9DXD1_9ALTE|nr:hypothetical protein [Salinimonas marina]QPG05711.1 hypothetical protein IT774_16910 [Salinimonas marina]